jgi:hypothetical protein
VRQKEEIFSQFNDRYQKAKTFWKSKFDELLHEKKKQLKMIQTFNTQMQTLHDEHMKTKKSLKRREKNIDQMIEKMFKQQTLLSQIFSELKPMQSSKSQINLHRYEIEYQKLKDDLKLYHETHLTKHSSAK